MKGGGDQKSDTVIEPKGNIIMNEYTYFIVDYADCKDNFMNCT